MTDKQIIELYFSRSENAITETNTKYGAYCKKISMNILQNEPDSEEALNDTWFKAWNTIPPQKPNPFKTYLGMLVRTVSINRYKYYTAQKRNGIFDVLLSEVEEMIPASQVGSNYENGQITDIINNFLSSTDKVSRMFFVRRYWYSDSISEIAKIYGVSEGKVKSSLFRSRAKLRAEFEKEGIGV